jgi:Xaa-Pro aminopeptidase
MTNPIPEYIDKQKFLEWVKSECPSQTLSTCKFIHRIVRDIESGTFDAHSTQEEITKLKGEREFHRGRSDTLEFRALRAEQELKEFKTLLNIMDRAKRIALANQEEETDRPRFKMDHNGNLTRIDS